MNGGEEVYSLVLRKSGKIVYRSRVKGIKPLVECVIRFSGRVEDAFLEDRVVGMAAARLIAYSGFISRVAAGAISPAALNHLIERGIRARGGPWNDRRQCRWERLSASITDDRDFFSLLTREFGMRKQEPPRP